MTLDELVKGIWGDRQARCEHVRGKERSGRGWQSPADIGKSWGVSGKCVALVEEARVQGMAGVAAYPS